LFLIFSDGVRHFDGSGISGIMTGSYHVGENLPHGIWGTSSSNVYLVGENGVIMRYGP
jgi:hypothetical protein